MANPEHLAILKQGAGVWNEWRTRNPQVQPDLSGTELWHFGYVSGSEHINFQGINFQRSNLENTSIEGADLRGANLSSANLRYADLSPLPGGTPFPYGDRLDLDMKLTANLCEANLIRADFSGANLLEATFGETIFGGTDLSNAELSFSEHGRPSFLDFQTLAKSWRLPLHFLRGCGLPDNYIEYLPSLLNYPLQFYSCFISYSTKDQEFADRLHTDLQDKGVRCWFATHDIRAGKKLHDQIDEAIRVYDRLLLILSDHSMDSEWVKTEIAQTRQKELNERRQVLFPISLVPFAKIREWKCFDADTGKDSAREIREYFIPDFSNWKDHDSYQMAFQRLVRDLKAEEKRSLPAAKHQP
jgi:uncharacterized protein YjbI with pentapeptide repeats